MVVEPDCAVEPRDLRLHGADAARRGALDLLAAFAMAFGQIGQIGQIGEVVADFVLTPIPTFLGLAALTLLYSRLACEGPLR